MNLSINSTLNQRVNQNGSIFSWIAPSSSIWNTVKETFSTIGNLFHRSSETKPIANLKRTKPTFSLKKVAVVALAILSAKTFEGLNTCESSLLPNEMGGFASLIGRQLQGIATNQSRFILNLQQEAAFDNDITKYFEGDFPLIDLRANASLPTGLSLTNKGLFSFNHPN